MKKIILLFTLLTSFAFSANQILFWVENPEMVTAYYNIFSAIADIFAQGSASHPNQFVNLLRLMFLIGGFFVFASGIFNSFGKGGEGAIGGYLKYLLIGVALLTLVFYKGDTEVWIISKTTADYCPGSGTNPHPAGIYVGGTKTYPDGTTVKRQVPTLLAYAFLFTNKIGTTMTEIAESAYSTPGMTDLAPQKMSKAGYMGALKGAMNLVAIDPSKVSLSEKDPRTGAARPPYDMGKAYRAMFSDCVLIPFSAKGTEGALAIAELKGTSDIHTYLFDRFDATGAKAAISVGGVIPMDLSMTYQGEVYNCGDFYTTVISPIYTQFYGESICGYGSIGQGAVSLIIGATSGAISEFQDIAVQAGLVTELEGSLSSLGVGVSGVGYASGKTRAEFIQSSLASGVYMAEMLPYLQMTIRAVLYGFFPFVFVMVLLPGGLKVLGTFFQTIIWVELWSPTAAIINMFMMSHATNQYSQIYGGSGLTMMSSVDMLSTGATIAGIGGYLYLSVPALTWLIMKGSAQMLGSITGAMGAGMARNITTQAINQDKALVAKTQEASVRSGKELSMAEMQHYDAIQGGRMEGAKLGVQMNAGMNTMADIEAMEETKKTKGYEFLSSSMGGAGAAGIGAALAADAARGDLTKANTGLQATRSNGVLTKDTTDAAVHNANVNTGGDRSKANHTVTKKEAQGSQDRTIAKIVADSNAMNITGYDRTVTGMTNDTVFSDNKNNAVNPGLGGLAGENQNKDIKLKGAEWDNAADLLGGTEQAINRMGRSFGVNKLNSVIDSESTEGLSTPMEKQFKGNADVKLRNQETGRMEVFMKEKDGTSTWDEANTKATTAATGAGGAQYTRGAAGQTPNGLKDLGAKEQSNKLFNTATAAKENTKYKNEAGGLDNATTNIANKNVTSTNDTISTQAAENLAFASYNKQRAKDGKKELSRNQFKQMEAIKNKSISAAGKNGDYSEQSFSTSIDENTGKLSVVNTTKTVGRQNKTEYKNQLSEGIKTAAAGVLSKSTDLNNEQAYDVVSKITGMADESTSLLKIKGNKTTAMVGLGLMAAGVYKTYGTDGKNKNGESADTMVKLQMKEFLSADKTKQSKMIADWKKNKKEEK